ncbi:MAG: hypothetical protein JEY91_19110, partial [Spirochaetaceae bacterium]|nr:hypothetical protein [Spirochaetaceae bacterium]
IVFDDSEDETLQDIELPDLDDIILEENFPHIEDQDQEIELPDLDDIILEDDDSLSEYQNQGIEPLDLDEPQENSDLPDLDEIIIDDIEDENIPDLDEILADSMSEPVSDLSEIELSETDGMILDDSLEIQEIVDQSLPEDEIDSTDNIFGDESELVDLDSLEQMAVEEESDAEIPALSDEDFANKFNERVEEIRDAAQNGNIPEELKDEIKDILLYMDQLLESLPDDKIQEFARSEHFEVYKKIFEELGIKK